MSATQTDCHSAFRQQITATGRRVLRSRSLGELRDAALTGGAPELTVYARRAVAEYRLTQPVRAARAALQAHLRSLGLVLADEQATRIAVAVVTAWIEEPEVGAEGK